MLFLFEKVKVLLVDNLIFETHLADVWIGCSNPPQGDLMENFHLFMSTEATEKQSFVCSEVYALSMVQVL